jgi:hypothetical protein
MSQQDYTVIMQTLSGNLSEGTPPRAKRPQATTTSGKVEKAEIGRQQSQPQRLTIPNSQKIKGLGGSKSAPPLHYAVDDGMIY